jgi:hypothetical protein
MWAWAPFTAPALLVTAKLVTLGTLLTVCGIGLIGSAIAAVHMRRQGRTALASSPEHSCWPWLSQPSTPLSSCR